MASIFGGGYLPGLVVISGILILVVLLKIKEGLDTWSRNNREPVRSDRALLLHKERTRTRGNSALASQGKPLLPELSVTWTLTFMTENHGDKFMELTDKEAKLLEEGMTGSLAWQGSRFISFKK